MEKKFPCKYLLETVFHLWTILGNYFIGCQINLKVLVSQYIPIIALNTVSTYMVRVCHPYDTILLISNKMTILCIHCDTYHTGETLHEDSTLHCTYENIIIDFISLQVDIYLMLGDHPSYLGWISC